jgi:hypothetical protein
VSRCEVDFDVTHLPIHPTPEELVRDLFVRWFGNTWSARRGNGHADGHAERIAKAIAALPPDGDPSRDEREEWIADEMLHARLDRCEGTTVRLMARVRVLPGREAEARRWVERELGGSWPRKRVERELGRMVEPLYERGEEPPRDVFDVDLIARLRMRSPRNP